MQILVWLKKNWMLVLLIIGAIYLVVNSFSSQKLVDSLMEKYNQQAQDHNKEIQKLEKLNKDEKDARALMEKHFNERMQEIDQKYESRLSELEKKRVVTKKTIIEDTKKDPQSLVKRVNESFGIPEFERAVVK